jgi:hypothetical protein
VKKGQSIFFDKNILHYIRNKEIESILEEHKGIFKKQHYAKIYMKSGAFHEYKILCGKSFSAFLEKFRKQDNGEDK